MGDKGGAPLGNLNAYRQGYFSVRGRGRQEQVFILWLQDALARDLGAAQFSELPLAQQKQVERIAMLDVQTKRLFRAGVTSADLFFTGTRRLQEELGKLYGRQVPEDPSPGKKPSLSSLRGRFEFPRGELTDSEADERQEAPNPKDGETPGEVEL